MGAGNATRTGTGYDPRSLSRSSTTKVALADDKPSLRVLFRKMDANASSRLGCGEFLR